VTPGERSDHDTAILTTPVGSKRWLEYGLVLAFYAVWTVVATYPLARHPSNNIDNWGDPLLNVWIIAWDLHQLGREPLRLFDAPIFYPAHNTLALSEILIVQAVEAMPIVALTHNFVLAYNLIVLASYVLGGFGAYLLLRHALPAGASLVGGAVYAYSFYRVGEYSHVQILSAQWIPFAILALLVLWERQRWRDAGLLTLFLVLQVLSSFYLGLFLTAAVGFVVIWLVATSRRRPSWTFVIRLAAAGALSLLVVLPFSIPYFQVVRELGLVRSIDDAIGGSATLQNYLAVPSTSVLYGSPTLPVVAHMTTDETLFPGIIPIGLALIGLAFGRQRRWSSFFLWLTIFGLIFSFGPRYRINPANNDGIPLPYGLLYAYVPGFQSIRVVGRLGVVTTLGIAGLASLGAAFILKRVESRKHWFFAVPLALLVAAETLAVPTRMTPVETASSIPPVYQWLAARPDDAPALELPTIESRYLAVSPELERQGHEQYLSIFHWHPTPSGYSGFEPPLFWSVIREAKAFPTDESVGFLQGMGVRYIIFHQDQYAADRWRQIADRLGQFGTQLQPVATFGPDSVYQFAEPTPVESIAGPWISLPSAGQVGETYRGFLIWPNSAAPIRLTNPTSLAVRATWKTSTSSQTQVVTVKQPEYLARGDNPVPFDLTTPSDPGQYDLTIEAATTSATSAVTVLGPTPEPAPYRTIPTVRFVAATVPTPAVSPGGVVFVQADWRVLHPTMDNYLFQTEIVNSHGDVVTSSTVDPFNGGLETGHWLPEATVRMGQSVILPARLGPDTYIVRLRVRFADDRDARLADAEGNPQDSIDVGKIDVR
jgi:hypothetical protein